MENMGTSTRTVGAPPPVMVEVTALTRQRLDELDRLRAIGMGRAMELREAGLALAPSPILTPEQTFRLKVRNVEAFDRIGRAVRQIMTLEFELLGLFEAPDRDAFPKLRKIKPEAGGVLARPWPEVGSVKPVTLPEVKDLGVRPDYRNGPMEDVVAGIRKTLGVEAPPNDPFAPPPERKAREPAPAAAPQAPPPPKPAPATVKLPEKAELSPAMKAALLAIKARHGHGFRTPSLKPKAANPARPPKRRRNRGPPK
jgi:hypothetical protein